MDRHRPGSIGVTEALLDNLIEKNHRRTLAEAAALLDAADQPDRSNCVRGRREARLHASGLAPDRRGPSNRGSQGLRWSDITWGSGPDDLRRALEIRETLTRGRDKTTPKSGRSRRVAMSRRLWFALRDRRVGIGGSVEGRVAPIPRWRYYRRFDKVCAAAGIGDRKPKDLRDTFASQLLTAGVQLGDISRQLGHATVAMTADHYARWAGGDDWRPPRTVGDAEVRADLLARLGVSPSIPAPATPPSARNPLENRVV